MKSVHAPRSYIIIIFALIIVTFLTGNVRTFAMTRAPVAAQPTATVPVDAQTEVSADSIPSPTPVLASADTTGIIALAIVIVAVVLIGAVWGGRALRTKSK